MSIHDVRVLPEFAVGAIQDELTMPRTHNLLVKALLQNEQG
ncbi:MAG: hypothetical protein ABSC36_04765 [Gaiellaceae bacterium]|jgi:hypothetical protein